MSSGFSAKTNAALSFLLALSLLSIPVYVYRFIGPFKITPSAVTIGLFLLSWLLARMFSARPLRLLSAEWALVAFTAASVLSWIPAADKVAAVKETAKYVVFALLVLATRETVDSSRLHAVRAQLAAAVAAGVALSICATLSFLLKGIDRALGFGNPNSLGAFLAMQLALATVLALQAPGRIKWLGWLGLLPILLGELLTYSRGGLVGAAIAVALILVLTFRKQLSRRAVCSALAVGLMLVAAAVLVSTKAQPVLHRFPSLNQLFADPNVSSRLELWKAAALLFLRNPLLGIGGSNFQLRYQPLVPPYLATANLSFAHNTVLNVAAEHGMLGLVPFLLAFSLYGWQIIAAILRGSPRDPVLPTASLGVTLAGLVTSLFGHLFSAGTQELVAIFMGIGLSTTLPKHDQPGQCERDGRPQPLNVLLVWHGAAGRAYHERFRALSNAGINLSVLAPKRWRENGRQLTTNSQEYDGYRIVSGTALLAFHGSLFFFLSGLTAELRKKPDIIHVHEEPWSLCAFQVQLLARLLSPHSKIVVESWQNIYKRFPPPFSMIERFTVQHAHALVAGSEEIAGVLSRKGADSHKCETIPLGTSSELFRPSTAVSCPDVPDGCFRIGYVGRLTKEKGLYVLLEAVTRLTHPYCLLMVGDGPDATALREHAADLNLTTRVKWLGNIPYQRLPELMNCMDVLVLPSLTTPTWKEQFGRVLIEAMACGVPVIGSSSGEIPNVVGECGLIVPEGNAEALASALERLAGDAQLRAHFAKLGRERVLENYAWDVIAFKTAQLYRRVL